MLGVDENDVSLRDIPGVFFLCFFSYTLISFSCHFYTNKDIDMRSFVMCSKHRVVFL